MNQFQDGITSSKCEVSFRISLACPAELASKGKTQPLTFFSVCQWISCSNMHRFFFLSCIKFISCYSKAMSPSWEPPLCGFPRNSHIITVLHDSAVIPISDELCWNRTTIRTESFGVFFPKEHNFLVAARSKKVNFVLFSSQPLCIGLLQQLTMKESTGQSSFECITSFTGSYHIISPCFDQHQSECVFAVLV